MPALMQAGTDAENKRVFLPVVTGATNDGGTDTDLSDIETRLASLEAALKEGVIYGPFFSLSPQVVRGEVVFAVYAYSNVGGIAKFVVNIPELGVEDKEYAVAREGLYGNSARVSFTVPEDMAIDTEINVSVYATDTKGASTLAVTKTVTVCDGIIAPPNITSPASGAVVNALSNTMNFTCSGFSSSGIDEVTDKYADWKITRDENGEDIIASVNGSNVAVNSCRFYDLGLSSDSVEAAVDVFVQARHGCSSGRSEWGVPTLIRSVIVNELPSGRKIWRHLNGYGSVLEWYDTIKKHQTFIADCSKYIISKLYTAVINLDSSYAVSGKNNEGNVYFDGIGVIAAPNRKYVTDAQLNALWAPITTAVDWSHMKTYFGQTQMNIGEWWASTSAVTVDGVTCCLPTRDMGFRIWCESEFIQALCPVQGYLIYQLYDKNTNGMWSFGTAKCNGILTSTLTSATTYSSLGTGGGVNGEAVYLNPHLAIPTCELL